MFTAVFSRATCGSSVLCANDHMHLPRVGVCSWQVLSDSVIFTHQFRQKIQLAAKLVGVGSLPSCCLLSDEPKLQHVRLTFAVRGMDHWQHMLLTSCTCIVGMCGSVRALGSTCSTQVADVQAVALMACVGQWDGAKAVRPWQHMLHISCT